MPKIDVLPVEFFTPVHNNAIARMPGRRFPGVIVQGDSLSILASLARDVARRASAASDPELQDDANELRDKLDELQEMYEKVLAEHGMELPYVKS
jgi:hypothetical protein